MTGWLAPSAGQNIPVEPGWYLPPQKIRLAGNRFLQGGKGVENTKEKSRVCFTLGQGAPMFKCNFQPRFSCSVEYFISTPDHELRTKLFQQSWVAETTLEITLLWEWRRGIGDVEVYSLHEPNFLPVHTSKRISHMLHNIIRLGESKS